MLQSIRASYRFSLIPLARFSSHSLNIVVSQDGTAASAARKIFLEYATLQDAANAERELAGRQFGDSVVEVTHFSEADYSSGNLR